MTTVSAGCCFVGEDPDDAAGRWAATFSVHWESDDGSECVDGPTGVSLAEAVRWGRDHAEKVSVLVGDAQYSAGATALDDSGEQTGTVRPWPVDGLTVCPRPFGTPLDGSVQEVAWRVRGTISRSDDTNGTVNQIKAPIENHPNVSSVEIKSVPGAESSHPTEIEVSYRAGDATSAVNATHELIRQALAEANPGAPPPRVNVQWSNHD